MQYKGGGGGAVYVEHYVMYWPPKGKVWKGYHPPTPGTFYKFGYEKKGYG